MALGFIRSPEAVFDERAYQDAWPHPGAALACAVPSSAKAAMATASVERRIVVKSVVPVRLSLHVACSRLKRGQKWRKSGICYHGVLRIVTFVITLRSMLLIHPAKLFRKKSFRISLQAKRHSTVPHGRLVFTKTGKIFFS